jgi:hypothetical protein
MQPSTAELLINAWQVTEDIPGETYEFVLNEALQVRACAKTTSTQKTLYAASDAQDLLNGMLFELNHVRVNPLLNNEGIIHALTTALEDIGVNIYRRPAHNSMAVCYRPLGEISDNVRFYMSDNAQLVFLSPTKKLRLVT